MGDMNDEDRIWKALGDPTRRSLLDDLAEQPRTTGDLVDRHPELCRTAVMKHLALLEEAGLVLVRREGRQRWNSINPVPIDRICGRWIHRHVRHLSGAANRLRDILNPKP
jgi:DNA-binding transcriptional ArsR family regulator